MSYLSVKEISGGLKEALGIKGPGVVSLVGAGGKTTLMFSLAKELEKRGEVGLCTTTTKIWEPSLEEAGSLFLSADLAQVINFVSGERARGRRMTLAKERLSNGKLDGISPGLVDELNRLFPDLYIIVEADGSKGRPLKAPGDWEPVIPQSTSLVVAMLGMDALGGKLDEENVFRAELAAPIMELALGEAISKEGVAKLVVHDNGLAKGSPATARIIAFINKVELGEGLDNALSLAREIMARGYPRIERVVLGSLVSARPVAGILIH